MLNQGRKKLGELLIEAGIITSEQLGLILDLQSSQGKKTGELMVEQGMLDEKQVVDALEFQLKIPRVDFNQVVIQPEVSKLISENLARRHMVIPVERENNLVTVAMADPLDLLALDDVKIATGLDVKPSIATKSEILTAIDRIYGNENAQKAVEEFKRQYNIEQIPEMESELLSEIDNAPVVKLVNSIIQHSLRMKASDIHIEPFERNFRVRFRVDGEMQEIMSASKTAHSAIVTRIKILGKMDIAEKRIPQDGRVEMTVDGKEVDLRISVLPTVYGEKVVIRLLGRGSIFLSKTQLGFSDENIVLFEKIIQNPNGIILVTGPTGSGKTTTLYAALRELNKINRNIITVEDPVEYRLDGINQVQVNIKAGLTFAGGLRSILRQDPDIIMVGEIRDSETAQIAVRAAITGHLVLSTVHTNDSASTVSRLMDMGIEPYLVSSSLVGIVAQRLVRRICPNCKTPYKPDRAELKILNTREDQLLYRGSGCSACNYMGYRGRVAVHEVMVINRDMRELIDRKATIDQIRNASIRHGTTTLKENCSKMVQRGITTIDEMLRATYSME